MEHIIWTKIHSKYQVEVILSLRNRSPTLTKECHMSRLSVPNLESDAGPSGQIYAQIKKAIGSVPNTFAAIAAHGPAALKAVLAADTVLAGGSLTKRDQEVIKLVISAAGGCDYCVAAHNHLAKLTGGSPRSSIRSPRVNPPATPNALRLSA